MADKKEEIKKKITAQEKMLAKFYSKKIGIDIATELGEKLLELKAPGIHFYTMNSAESTVAIAKNLGLIKL